MKRLNRTGLKPASAVLPLLMTALAACGGGGGDGAGNAAPMVDAGSSQDVLARKAVTLEATASDTGGSIASFAWVQTAGPDVTLSASDDNVTAFTAPDVSEQQTLTFKVTATDNTGAAASDTVDVTVTPSVTLKAKAYDGPLAGAMVTVTVGDKTYEATADANGQFTLDIGSPDPAAMITIVAKGGAGQENAELVSIAGSFGALTAAAGADGTLDASENGGVDVTNLSTAKAVLMIQANGGNTPADDATVTDLEKSLDSDAMLELATVIKLVIDAGVPLPSGINSTYDLAKSDSAIDTVIQSAGSQDPELFQDTLDAILSDPDLLPSFTAGKVPNLYFINRTGHYIYANRGYFLELNEDGSGQIYGEGSSLSAALNWSVVSGVLKIAIDDADPLVQNLSCRNAADEPESCVQTITDAEIRLISDGMLTDSLNVTFLGTVNYSVSNDLDGPVQRTYNRLGMAPGALKPFTAADVEGTWSVPLSTHYTGLAGAEYETGLLTFNTNGTGTRQADAVGFGWSIDEDGVLHIVFDDGDQLDAYWMRDEGDMAIDAMFVLNAASGDTYAMPYFAAELDSELVAGLTTASADGLWDYIDNAGLVYELDSSTATATARYFNLDGDVVAEYPGELTFNGDYYDVISWYDAGVPVANCGGTCFYSYVSTWYPLSEDETGRIFMLEIDNGWEYDGADSADYYRGALYHHHAVNRWLKPVPGGTSTGSGKLSMPATATTRGDLVRGLMDEEPMDGHIGR